MPSFNKVHAFVEAVAEKKHNLGSDQLTIALTAAANAPTATGSSTLSDLTEITYTGLSSRNVTTTGSAQTAGTYKLVCNDLTLTATGASVGPFRYAVLYNDTATNDDLVGYWDYGADITLATGQAFDLDFDATNGVLTLA